MQRNAYRFTKPKEQLKWMEDEGTQVIATGYQAHSSLLRIFGQWLIFPTCKKQRLWRGDVDLILGNEWMLQNINGQSSGEKYRRTKADTLFSNVIFGVVRPFRYLHAALPLLLAASSTRQTSVCLLLAFSYIQNEPFWILHQAGYTSSSPYH